MEKLIIRKVAVLGAGVMGAQIAAHCANAGLEVLLYDLSATDGPRNKTVLDALASLKKLEPTPLALTERLALISPANYDDDLARLQECELVIEAIAERLDWKQALFARIAPYLRIGAVLASNTSGLSVNQLAQGVPVAQRTRFCGIHFFNPPRYMPLVELIPAWDTDLSMLDQLETWLTRRLGKNVIRARDTPNFVANRIGVFSVLAVMHHTARLGLGFDEVDALTGPLIGRPKSATYRTADVVGLDTLAHVVATMQANLADDPWHRYFEVPDWLKTLIAHGAVGQKSRAGIYRKDGKAILVLDAATGQYRPQAATVAPEVLEMLALRDPRERLSRVAASPHPQAQFLWAIFRDLFHYCAVQLEHIANHARDVDLAMRWGFGWSQGPFEIWQAAGWHEVVALIRDDIAAGRSMDDVPLPDWVDQRDGVHGPAGSFAADRRTVVARSALPVYQRQLYPDHVFGESREDLGETLWQSTTAGDGVRLWRRPDVDLGIGILSFDSKLHAIGSGVLDGLIEAIQHAERDLDGLVIWHDAPFAVGANLRQVAEACAAGAFDRLEQTVARFQQASLAIQRAQVPVVAAVQGMALGGGCEFLMHAAHRVMALESYIGLVEVGVGLIPAGGGSRAFAIQAHRMAQRAAGGDVFPFIQNSFQTVAMATVAKSALEAVKLGFAQPGDDILFNPHELLFVAIQRARSMAEAGYAPPPVEHNIVVAGRNGIASCEMMLVNMLEGGMISAYDYTVARAAATALCGGEVDSGSRVSEQWLLDVERSQFMNLLHNELTQQRIKHMLETGKPLRN